MMLLLMSLTALLITLYIYTAMLLLLLLLLYYNQQMLLLQAVEFAWFEGAMLHHIEGLHDVAPIQVITSTFIMVPLSMLIW
jgi:hypothetical protein